MSVENLHRWAGLAMLSAWLLILPTSSLGQAQEPVKLFDGKSFQGWEGDTQKTFRIEEEAVVAGSLDKMVPRNEFLCTEKEYEDFELKLKFKLEGTEGFVNGGVQFRSSRIPNHHEMIGYQADIGAGYDGALYDESRRKRVWAGPEKEMIKSVLVPNDWNEYKIRCVGNSIKLYVNGKMTVDYTEIEPGIAKKGVIGLQIHGNGKAIIRFKEIELTELKAASK